MDRAESKSERPGNIVVEFVLPCEKNEIYVVLMNIITFFIRNVKSRSNIIVERNFSTILKNLPRNHNLMMDSNGKIIT